MEASGPTYKVIEPMLPKCPDCDLPLIKHRETYKCLKCEVRYLTPEGLKKKTRDLLNKAKTTKTITEVAKALGVNIQQENETDLNQGLEHQSQPERDRNIGHNCTVNSC